MVPIFMTRSEHGARISLFESDMQHPGARESILSTVLSYPREFPSPVTDVYQSDLYRVGV